MASKLTFIDVPSEQIEEALAMVSHFFNLDELHADQNAALKSFISGKDLYFSAPTGYGKSLIFQCFPLIVDLLKDQAIGTSTVLVIEPLVSLMLDQVSKMKNTAVSAAAVFDGQDEDTLKGIENGDFSLVYSSPESMLSSEKWRSILSSEDFRNHCEIVVVDEAHCVVHWGTSDAESNVPFREWYGNLLQLKSLLLYPRMAVFTATASKTTKRLIFEILQLNPLTTQIIEKDPNKDNIWYMVNYVDNDWSLGDILHNVITDVKQEGVNTQGTLIFCRTRKQCSLLYRTFVVALEQSMYYGKKTPKNRIVEMFHAGTPDSVKEHILSTVTNDNGHIRVVICSIAFGMGIDCKYITRIIHFGGSKCIESYLQECGRAGRNGKMSTCYLCHNGLLMKNTGEDMKNYVSSTGCCRKEISSVFPASRSSFNVSGCKCCDVCTLNCNCGNNDCKTGLLSLSKPVTEEKEQAEVVMKRMVTKEDKSLLQQKVKSYQSSLLPSLNDLCTPVSYPNVFLEFGSLQIKQTIENCDKMFGFNDIKKYVEIWRNVHANNILLTLHEVFGDFDLEISTLKLTTEEECHECIDSDWVDLRDDTELHDNINTSSFFRNMDNVVDELETSALANDANISALLTPIVSSMGELSDYVLSE